LVAEGKTHLNDIQGRLERFLVGDNEVGNPHLNKDETFILVIISFQEVINVF